MPPTPQPTHAQAVDHRGVAVGADQRIGHGHRDRSCRRAETRPWPGTRGSPGARCRRWAARRGNCRTPSGPSAGTRSARDCAGIPARRSAPATSAVLNRSTCTEWSITRSTGISGLIFLGSPPSRCMAARMAARSTTAGTPVKSCSSTRDGLKGISTSAGAAAFQRGQVLDVVFADGKAVAVAQRRFQQHANRKRQLGDLGQALALRAWPGGTGWPGRGRYRTFRGPRKGSVFGECAH